MDGEGLPLHTEEAVTLNVEFLHPAFPLSSAPSEGVLLDLAGSLRCFLHHDVLPDVPGGEMSLSPLVLGTTSSTWGWTGQLEPQFYHLITSHLPHGSVLSVKWE